MRFLTITSKRKAESTSGKSRYDLGKYAHSHIGRTVEVGDGIRALWAERRRDKKGPYYALFCCHTGG
jgi:hypothetical protein